MLSRPSFSCIYCSSEDSHHPFSTLLDAESTTFWISSPSPRYPIESVIDLKGLFIIESLEVVSHEFMIASRVDVFGTKSEIIDDRCEWESIGFFTFNENQRSSWRARELKNIKIGCIKCRFLRLAFQECYMTPPNAHQQVAIVSLQINGKYDVKPRVKSVDELVNAIIQNKQRAIEEENYLLAEECKEQLIHIENNREEIEKLFDQKKQALFNEQYLQADGIISKIFSIVSPQDYQYNVQPNVPLKQSLGRETEEVKKAQENNFERMKEETKEKLDKVDPKETDPKLFLTDCNNKPKALMPTNDDSTLISIDEKPKRTDQPLPISKRKEIDEDVPTFKNQTKNVSNKKSARPPKRAMPDFSKEPKSDEPDQLSDEDRAEAQPLIALFGESVVALAYSKAWLCKVNGFKKLCELLKGLKTSKEKNNAFKAMFPLIKRRFNDGLKAVYCSAVEETINLLSIPDLEIAESNISHLIHQILPLVISRLGDSNQRIDESAHNFALWSCDKDKLAFQEVHSYAITPPSPTQYHLWAAKLKLLKNIIEKYGIGPGTKLNLPEVMGIISPSLESRKLELRQQAFSLLMQLYEIIGSPIEKYISNAPRFIKEQFKREASKKE